MMTQKSDTYKKYTDEAGEAFFCLPSALEGSRGGRIEHLADCVEVSTVGRYAGNLDISD